MKRTNSARNLNEFVRNQYRMKVITLIITAWLVGFMIILPATKVLGFAYVTYHNFANISNNVPQMVSDAEI